MIRRFLSAAVLTCFVLSSAVFVNVSADDEFYSELDMKQYDILKDKFKEMGIFETNKNISDVVSRAEFAHMLVKFYKIQNIGSYESKHTLSDLDNKAAMYSGGELSSIAAAANDRISYQCKIYNSDVNFGVTNGTSSFEAIGAGYKDGELIDIISKHLTYNTSVNKTKHDLFGTCVSGTTANYITIFNVSSDIYLGKAGKDRFAGFVWENLSTLKPLGPITEIR